MNKPSQLIPLNQAIEKLQSAVKCCVSEEVVTLEESLDRILAQDIDSPINVPDYDNSAMDGYAFRFEDLENHSHFNIAGISLAGTPFQGTLQPGDCVRIMTGAKMPAEADTVIMQEQVTKGDDVISLTKRPSRGENVRLRGNDITAGNCVLHAGKRLSPIDIGLLASIGIDKVNVKQKLKVALFSTGDELRLPGQPLDESCIYDSNRFMIAALLQRLDVEVVNYGIIKDDPDALRQTFLQASEECQAIVTSGGVSVGDADYTKDILEEVGNIEFWKLAIKPGKPFAFGFINKTAFFGLPGNPVSAAVTFHQLALPCIQIMAGESVEPTITLPAIVQDTIKKRPGRTDFQRGNYLNQDGVCFVKNSGDQSSGMLTSMSRSNCFIVLEQDRDTVKTEESAQILPYDRWLK